MSPKAKHICILVAVITCITALAGYCLFAIIYFGRPSEKVTCQRVDVCIKDSATYRFTNELEVRKHLAKHRLEPVNKLIGIDEAHRIEQCLKNMNVCKDAVAYMGYDGTFYIQLWQRCPVFRVMPKQGENYYIDQDRKRMPISNNFTPHLPILSGDISLKEAQGVYFDFMQYMQNDIHWKNLVAEVTVLQGNVTLTCKQGVPYVELGKLEQYEKKMEKLRAWMEQYAHKNDATIYKKISIQYNDLIFCTQSHPQ